MKPTVVEIRCKSVLNRVNAPNLGFRWSINPYRGCAHACRYCYARRYHEYLELGPGADFETRIFAKVNAPAVLRGELARPGWRQEQVAVGTAVDPYQPAEGRYRITRGILEALRDYWTPCSLVTKNSMILRDTDLLIALARGPGCSVWFSITTVDPALARQLEPDTPPPRKRLKVLEALVAAGVDAGVLLAPVLPGLTDGRASLEAVVKAAAEHGARFLSSGVLRLEGSVKEVYTGFVAEELPQLAALYKRLYPGPYAPRAYRQQVARRVAELRARYGLPGPGGEPGGGRSRGRPFPVGGAGSQGRPALQTSLGL